jgi:hypothetical protein
MRPREALGREALQDRQVSVGDEHQGQVVGRLRRVLADADDAPGDLQRSARHRRRDAPIA